MGKVMFEALASMLIEAIDLAAIRSSSYHHREVFRSRRTDDWFKSKDMLGYMSKSMVLMAQ